jgi:hypothetical protein
LRRRRTQLVTKPCGRRRQERPQRDLGAMGMMTTGLQGCDAMKMSMTGPQSYGAMEKMMTDPRQLSRPQKTEHKSWQQMRLQQ